MLTREDFLQLLAPQPKPCVSILLPTHRHGPDNLQDGIRFKNLVKTARGLLADAYPKGVVDDVLRPVDALSDAAFWRDQLDGLAVFAAHGFSAVHRLPMPLPELAVVADSFHVRPLLGFLKANRRFHVLSLSQKNVTLYSGTPWGLGPVDLRRVPRSLREALGVEERESGMKAHSAGGGGVFQGRGAPAADRKDDLLRFFRAIDRALCERVREDRIPLVLAGPAYYFPIYRDVTRHPDLAPAGVEGSFDGATPEELHAKAWPAARAHFKAEEDAVLAEYERLAKSGLATDVLTRVTAAAVHGQVRKLFVQEGKLLFGRMNERTGDVLLNGRQVGAFDDDVLDDLTEAVLARGGDVFEIPVARMPMGAAAAAILRW